jgi:DNA-binding NarL/FixJ family response regulator
MDKDAVEGRVLIADDHPMFREAMRQIVAATLPGHAIVEASCLDAAEAEAGGAEFDLILLDINMPGMNGFNGLISLRNHLPATPVIIVSAEESPETMRQALTLGAAGYIPKSMDRSHMIAAVEAVLAGEVFVPTPLTDPAARAQGHDDLPEGFAALTASQRKVLEMLVAGKSNKVIAFELGVTEGTVKAHVSAILGKMKVNSRTQAVLNAAKLFGRSRAL